MALLWRKHGGALVLLASALVCIGAWAQNGPTIFVGEPVEVRPGETATLTIRAVGDPGELIQLTASAESPAGLAPAAWSAAPTAAPRLDIELSPPAGAAPGTRELSVHATGSGGFTTQATAVWRVLAARCSGAVEYDAGGTCLQCPPNHVPNATKTACDACPPNTERQDGVEACTECPTGQTSQAGANCGCGTAARLTAAGCVDCPPHTDSRRNALNCNVCPPGQHRPAGQESCGPCPVAATGTLCAASTPSGASASATATPANTSQTPKLTITASRTEIVESATAHPLTLTVTLSQPAPAGTVIRIKHTCAACQADYSPLSDYYVTGLSLIEVPEGHTTASKTGTMRAQDDLVSDDGEVVEFSARNTGYTIETAKITLREPREPTIVVRVPSSSLSPSALCGGSGRLCLLETVWAVNLVLEVLNPSTQNYRRCRLAMADGPNTATIGRGGQFLDYQLTGGTGVRLHPPGWSATETLAIEYDNVTELAESLTLRGECDDSSDGNAHHHLRWAPTTIWIADVPWPTLTVERPVGGYVLGPDIECGSGGRGHCTHSSKIDVDVTLTAVADARHRFVQWGGACSGTEPTCTVHLDADKTATAEFAVASHVLTVERPENGYLTGDGIDCGSGTRADCEEPHPVGSRVRLTATADANHELTGWSGPCASIGPHCDVVMSEARTVGASFGLVPRRLLVSPPDLGRITGPGIDCGGAGADCAESYDHGTQVTLTATADAGSEFVSWSGDCVASANACTVTMDGMEVIGATFAQSRRTLTVTPPTNGYVTTTKGINCGSGNRTTCTITKDHGTTLVVRATADEGYEFESWSGCDSEWPKCQFTLEADLTVGATFVVAKRTLTVTPPTNGYVTAPGISCGAGNRTDCTERYTLGTSVTLTATATTGHDFQTWGGNCSGTSETCTVEMADDRTATATFKPEKRTLSVTVTGAGTVTGPEDFSCSSGTCTQEYDYGTSVTLTATEATGHDFEKWGGSCSDTSTTCTLEMTDARSATATFKPEKRTLSVTVTGTGTVTGTEDFSCSSGTCTQDYDYGTSVTLTATEATGHDFEKWSETCSGTSTTCTLEMTDARSATAKFKPETRTLSVTVTGTGTVTGTEDFTCSSGTCTQDYDYGTSVTLTATEATGHDFEKWSGSCTGTSTTCTLEMTDARSATAKFKPEKRTLSVTVTGTGTVTGTEDFTCSSGTCTQDYDYGTSVTLTATEATGHDFEKWTGSCTGTSTTCTLEMTDARTTTAKFKPEKRTLSVTVASKGTVAGTSDFSCSSGTCTQEYDYGASVTLTATEATGHDFEKWSGHCTGTSTTCTLEMTENRAATAKFKPEKRTLTVTRPSDGYITATGIDCGPGRRSDCRETYDYGTSVTLRATANTGYDFDEWGGSCSGSSRTCTLEMTENRTAKATFDPQRRPLRVTIDGQGEVSTYDYTCTIRTCLWYYDYDSTVRLRADADTGHDFDEWTGACEDTSSSTCWLDITGSLRTTAKFKPEKRTLTVTTPTNGYVTATGINCGPSASRSKCTAEHDYDSRVVLTAHPADNYVVSLWSGCDRRSTGTRCEVTMKGAKTVGVTFIRRYQLKVDPRPSNGRVVEGPALGRNIDCGTRSTDCKHLYDDGEEVTVEAKPDPGYVFSAWSGVCSRETEDTCDVTMDAAKTVSATFVRRYQLTVTPPSNGSVVERSNIDCDSSSTADCTQLYDEGTKVTLTADPDDGYAVSLWSGCDQPTTGTACIVTMNSAKGVSVTFVKQYELTVTEPSNGSVVEGPVRNRNIDCDSSSSADCKELYNDGKEVRLTADPDRGYDVSSWNGCDQPTTGTTCKVTMDASKTVSVTFVPQERTLTVKRPSHGYVTEGTNINCGSGSRAKCEAKYDYDTTVTLTAHGDTNYQLDSWRGCKNNTKNPCEVVIDDSNGISVTFKPDCPSDCALTPCNGRDVCKCEGSSCPSGFAQHKDCSTTEETECTGDTDGCGRRDYKTKCKTNFHSFSNKAQETCNYEHRDRSWLNCTHDARICRARITEIGCLPSTTTATNPRPGDGPEIPSPSPGVGGAGDDEEWSEPETGYILADFECGAKANTCEVEFEDETVTTDDHGVVDKDDTDGEWRWECHSDNGTVRQCSASKDGG